MIFPSLIGKQEKDFSKPATSRVNNYRKKLGFTARDKTFHSTRHTIADELRNQNVEEYSISKILGHSKTDVTSGYGSDTSLLILKKYIDSCYDDFDFEPLKQMKL
ncbi:MAG: hypothetical protein JKY84_05610 [Emcibacteraceae bacterium]|nr:hypothetical protein [Emcibacteraceae bacterium]